VSEREIMPARMLKIVPCSMRDHAKVNCYPTSALSLFYGEVTYPMRGFVDLTFEGAKKFRRLAVWRLMKEDGYSVRQVIEILADWFFIQTHRRPQFAFMKSMPMGVDNGFEIVDVMLFEAEWAFDKCVLIGG